MLQCQIRNKVAWKSDLQEQCIKAGLGLQNQALHIYCNKCFSNGTDTDPHVTEDHYMFARGLVADQSMMGWKHFLTGNLVKYWIAEFDGERWMWGGKGGRLNSDSSNQGNHHIHDKSLAFAVWPNTRMNTARASVEKVQTSPGTCWRLKIKQEPNIPEGMGSHWWSTRRNSTTWRYSSSSMD